MRRQSCLKRGFWGVTPRAWAWIAGAYRESRSEIDLKCKAELSLLGRGTLLPKSASPEIGGGLVTRKAQRGFLDGTAQRAVRAVNIDECLSHDQKPPILKREAWLE